MCREGAGNGKRRREQERQACLTLYEGANGSRVVAGSAWRCDRSKDGTGGTAEGETSSVQEALRILGRRCDADREREPQRQQNRCAMKIQWTTQNEAVDADGFLLEGTASFAVECELLKEWGCPDTNKAKLVSVEVVERDASVTTAEVSDAMARWLFNETD